MRTLNGMHLGSYGLYHGVEQMFDMIGPNGSITVLDECFEDRENGYWWFTWPHNVNLGSFPNLLVHLRMYWDNGRDRDGRQVWPGLNWVQIATYPGMVDTVVDELYKRLTQVRRWKDGNQWDIPPIEEQPFKSKRLIVSLINEPCLRVEGHPEAAYADGPGAHDDAKQEIHDLANNLQADIIEKFDRKYPGRAFAFASADEADGHEPVGWAPDRQFQLPSRKRLMGLVDVLIKHAYGDENVAWALTQPKPATEQENPFIWKCYKDFKTLENYLRWSTCRPIREAGWRDKIDGVHPGGSDLGGECTQYKKPYLISEFGAKIHNPKHGEWRPDRLKFLFEESLKRHAATGRCLGVDWFGWLFGPEHYNAIIWNDEDHKPMVSLLKGLTNHHAAPWPPTIVPPVVPPTGGGGLKTYKLAGMDLIDLRDQLPDTPGAFAKVPFTEKEFISVHHTVTNEPTTLDGAVALAKAIYSAHKAKGWGGIGYNVLIVGQWAFYVGEFNTERAAVGACPQANRRGVHVALAGTYTNTIPSDATLATLKKVLANIQHAYGFWMPIVPHRLFNSNSQFDTACPGDTWRQWWNRILRAVGE
jgi:hypothetical protein